MRIKLNAYIACVAIFLCASTECIYSQKLKWNFGLSRKQSSEVIPHSKHSFQTANLKKKAIEPGELSPLSDWEYQLSKGWEMIEGYKARAAGKSVFAQDLDTSEWYSATVPGTVLTTLVDQGVYPDPYWGLNNLLIPDTLCRMDWWYRNSFSIPRNNKGEKVKLILNGINYKAEVWFNHQLLGTMTGAFERGIFDITPWVDYEKKNLLAIRILPPNNPGIPHEANKKEGIGPNGGALCLDGPTFISSEGWDWIPGIRDRNMGIWQDVRVKFGNELEIVDTHVITDLPLPDTTSVNFIVQTEIYNSSKTTCTANLHFNIGDVSAVYPVSLNANEKRMIKLTSDECKELQMKNPRLWWPNGYGEQYLYDASLSLISSGKDTLDVKKMRIGIRELEYELSAYEDNSPVVRLNYNPTAALQDGKPVFDAVKRKKTDSKVRYTNYDGEFVPNLLKPVSSQGIELIKDSLMKEYMVIKVNGQRIYCKGGNWGMDDGMKRVSRERLEPTLKLHKNMNYNMIRNWTGESTEEVFYELCDEYGMLVMNDFWISTDGFNLNPLDNCLFVRNVTETVRRFRNHPSIALWCARNEGFAPNELEYMLAATLAKEDGSRHYTGNSRSLNSSGSGPWRYQFDAGWYYRSLAGGFRSEVGTPSLPTAETVREFMAEEDTWPISDVWYYHDWHNHRYGSKTFSELYKEGMDRKLGPSDNLDDFCRKAQLINYESHRAIFEAWNSKMWNDASGVLLWMSHPAWPSMVWQNYSSNGETAGAYYGTQKACRPLHIQMSLNSQHKVDIINTTLKEYRNLKVEVVVYDKLGKKIRSSQQRVSHVTANALTPVTQLEDIEGLPDFSWVKLVLTTNNGKLLDDNVYWLNQKEWDGKVLSDLPVSSVNVSVKNFTKKANHCEGKLIVKNPGQYLAAAIALTLRDAKTDAPIRPAYFDDGYFYLMPGESKEIRFQVDCKEGVDKMLLRVDGYNVELKDILLNK